MDLSSSSARFVGRQGELATLALAYEGASHARPGIVCIEGPPGIGKTALVRRFLVDVQPQTALCASGDEAESGLPWGVLSQLARAPQSEWCAALRHLQSLTPDVDPLGVGRRLLEALGSLQQEQPLVLVVEDLHWVDQPSARALRFALRRLTADQVLVVLTTRQEGHLHAEEGWQRLVEDQGQRLRLAGLGPREIAEMAGSHWSAPASAVAARRLWEHSEGNPFYLRCLIEELDPK